MKIIFSKTLAAVLAATTVTAVSGISALAAVTDVVTTTTYDWSKTAQAATTDVTVTSTITADAADKGAQVTYLVATPTPTETGAIKYIDQKPVGEDGTVAFEFTAKQDQIYGGTITAKFGSDASFTMPTFTFKEGVDYFTKGSISHSKIDAPVEVDGDLVIFGKVGGENVTTYGATITIGGTTYELPAYGTIDGVFCVVVNGVTAGDVTETGTFAR